MGLLLILVVPLIALGAWSFFVSLRDEANYSSMLNDMEEENLHKAIRPNE